MTALNGTELYFLKCLNGRVYVCFTIIKMHLKEKALCTGSGISSCPIVEAIGEAGLEYHLTSWFSSSWYVFSTICSVPLSYDNSQCRAFLVPNLCLFINSQISFDCPFS